MDKNLMVLLEVRMKFEEFITEREGMIAENKVREAKGEQMAYPDEMFFNIQRKMELLRYQVTKLRGG